MFKKKLFIIFLFLTFISCSNRKSSTVIKLAHSLDVSHPVHKAMVFMSEKVKEKSGGE